MAGFNSDSRELQKPSSITGRTRTAEGDQQAVQEAKGKGEMHDEKTVGQKAKSEGNGDGDGDDVDEASKEGEVDDAETGKQ